MAKGRRSETIPHIGPLDAERMLLRPAVQGLQGDDRAVYRIAMGVIDGLFERVEALTNPELSLEARAATGELIEQVAFLVHDEREKAGVRRSLWSAIEFACGLCQHAGSSPEAAAMQAESLFGHFHRKRAAALRGNDESGLKSLALVIEKLQRIREADSKALPTACLDNRAFLKELNGVLLRIDASATRETLRKEIRVARRNAQSEEDARQGRSEPLGSSATRPRERSQTTATSKKGGAKPAETARRGRPRVIGNREKAVIAKLWRQIGASVSKREFHERVAIRIGQPRLARATLARALADMTRSRLLEPK